MVDMGCWSELVGDEVESVEVVMVSEGYLIEWPDWKEVDPLEYLHPLELPLLLTIQVERTE